MRPDDQERLASWKTIAIYLQCNERTVKRWEQDRALPVHRLPGPKRGGVFAYRSELDAWLRAEKLRAEEASSETIPTGEFPPDPAGEPVPVSRGWLIPAVAATISLLVLSATFFLGGNHKLFSFHHVPEAGAEALYNRGRYLWNLRTSESLAQAIDAFTQAIVKDASYAEAYAGLAESYDLLPQFGEGDLGKSFTRAIAAADRAIQLNPNLAAAHRARAFALFFWNWDISGSDAEFQRSLALDPNAAQTHQWYASTLHQRLNGAECLRQIDDALRLNPASAAIAADAALFHAEFGDLDAGLKDLKEIEQTQPALSSPTWFQRQLYFASRNYPAYIDAARRYALITRAPDDLALANALAVGWRSGGKIGLLEARVKALTESFDRGTEPGFDLGETLVLLGRAKEALPYFRRAFEKHDPALMTLEIRLWPEPLSRDPAYAALFSEIRARVHGGPPSRPGIVPISFRFPQ